MEQLITTDTLRIFETTKDERKAMVESSIQNILEGNANPLHIHLQTKHMEAFIKELTSDKRYKEIVQEEAEKNGKDFQMFNAKFQVKEAGTKYDFSVCGDPEWKQLNAEMETLKAKIKEREAFLKNIPESGLEQLNRESGELEIIYRPSKTSTTTIAVTLK